MILWKFKEEPELRESHAGTAHRNAIEVGFWHIGIVHQYLSKSTNEWTTTHTGNYELWINRHFHLGPSHEYYDGPHCAFDLGWLHILYAAKDDWCEKCYSGR